MRKLASLLLSMFAFCVLTVNAAANMEIEEGKQYKLLPEAVQFHAKRTDGKVQVVEFFSYACPHCYHVEPQIEEWLSKKKPQNVQFDRSPVVFFPGWEELAKGYYVATELNMVPEMQNAIFEAIHKDHKNLMTHDALLELYTAHKVTKEQFEKVYTSFGVQRALDHDKVLSRDYAITGVPSIVVDGKYITDLSMSGGPKNLMEVVDYLIEKDAKAKTSSKK